MDLVVVVGGGQCILLFKKINRELRDRSVSSKFEPRTPSL